MATTYITVFGITDTGVVRSNNEDAFALVDLTRDELVDVTRRQTSVDIGPRGAVLIVSDGMGGQQAGEVASALVVQSIREHLAKMSRGLVGHDALRVAVEDANRRVIQASEASNNRGMGATCTALLVSSTEVVTAEVGDSRAYLLRKGRLVPITKDQTYVQLLVDRGAIPPEAIGRSAAKNVILQAIGKNPELLVAQRQLSLRRDDQLLVCSDGLFSELTEHEILSVVALAGSLEDAASKLVVLAKDRGGRDNITVVLARITGPDLPEADSQEAVEATLHVIRPFTVGVPPI